jgi:hypothetical protein
MPGMLVSSANGSRAHRDRCRHHARSPAAGKTGGKHIARSEAEVQQIIDAIPEMMGVLNTDCHIV